MHNCKSPFEPLPGFEPALKDPLMERRRRSGFSLIEVSMALAIVAIAFVALIGLLPAGMKVFEAAANQTAQTRMVSHLTSLVQAADYGNIGVLADVLYYYDVDGGFVDTDKAPATGAENRRIYVAKMLTDNQNIVGGLGAEKDYIAGKTAIKVLIVMGRNDPNVLVDLDKVNTPAGLSLLKPGTRVATQAIVVTRMDLEPQ